LGAPAPAVTPPAPAVTPPAPAVTPPAPAVTPPAPAVTPPAPPQEFTKAELDLVQGLRDSDRTLNFKGYEVLRLTGEQIPTAQALQERLSDSFVVQTLDRDGEDVTVLMTREDYSALIRDEALGGGSGDDRSLEASGLVDAEGNITSDLIDAAEQTIQAQTGNYKLPNKYQKIPRDPKKLAKFRDDIEAWGLTKGDKLAEGTDNTTLEDKLETQVAVAEETVTAINEVLNDLESFRQQAETPPSRANLDDQLDSELADINNGDPEVDEFEAEFDEGLDAAAATGQPVFNPANGETYTPGQIANIITQEEEDFGAATPDAIADPLEEVGEDTLESLLMEFFELADLDKHDPRTGARVRKARIRKLRGRKLGGEELTTEEAREIYNELHQGSSSKETGLLLGAFLRGVALTSGRSVESLVSKLSLKAGGRYNTETEALLQKSKKKRPVAEIKAELARTNLITTETLVSALGEAPEYLGPVIDFLRVQREKLLDGRMTVRDLAKAYFLTVSSQGAGQFHLKTIQRKHPTFTGEGDQAQYISFNKEGDPMVRPEDLAAWWLTTPLGQRALDQIEEGNFNKALWKQGAKIRNSFGDNRLSKQGALKADYEVRPGEYSMGNLQPILNLINEAKGNTKKIDVAMRKLNGVSDAKSPFIQHFFGIGTDVTLDAQEIDFWLTSGGAGSNNARTIRLKAENRLNAAERNLRKRVDLATGIKNTSSRAVMQTMLKRVRRRLLDLRRERPDSVVDTDEEFYLHIMHHWIWDRAKGTDTPHTGMMNVMRLAQTAGLSQSDVDSVYFNALANDRDRAEEMVADKADAAGFVYEGFHGTTHSFEKFEGDKRGSKEGFLGRTNYFSTNESDAEANYLEDGPDLDARISSRAEELATEMGAGILAEDILEELANKVNMPVPTNADEEYELAMAIARSELVGPDPKVLHVRIKLENPVVVDFRQSTKLSHESTFIEGSDGGGNLQSAIDAALSTIETELSVDFEVLQRLAAEALGDAAFEGAYASEIMQSFREGSDFALNLTDENGNSLLGDFIREFYFALGYDGVILKNVGRRFSGMSSVGVDGTDHIHVSNPNQIKLADVETKKDGETVPLSQRFDASSPSILRQEDSEGDATIKGFLERKEDGSAVLAAMKSADESTALHETAHFVRPFLSDNHQQLLQSAYGVTDNNWSVEAEERYARDFERYVREGQIPKGILPRVKEAFEALSRIIRNIYKSLKNSPLENEIHPNVKRVFDELFIAGASPALQAVGEPELLGRQAITPDEIQVGDRIRYQEGRGPASVGAEGRVTSVSRNTETGRLVVGVESLSEGLTRDFSPTDNDSIELVDRTDRALLEVETPAERDLDAARKTISQQRQLRENTVRRRDEARKRRDEYIQENADVVLDENGNIRQRQVERDDDGNIIEVIDPGMPPANATVLAELKDIIAEESASLNALNTEPEFLKAQRDLEMGRLTKLANDESAPVWARAIARRLIHEAADRPDVPPLLDARINRETTAFLKSEFEDITEVESAHLKPILSQVVLQTAQDDALTINEGLAKYLDWGALGAARGMEVRELMQAYGRVTPRAAEIEMASELGFIPTRAEVEEALAEVENPWPSDLKKAVAEAKKAAVDENTPLPDWMAEGGGLYMSITSDQWVTARSAKGLIGTRAVSDSLLRLKENDVTIKFYDNVPVTENLDTDSETQAEPFLARAVESRFVEAAWDADGKRIWPDPTADLTPASTRRPRLTPAPATVPPATTPVATPAPTTVARNEKSVEDALQILDSLPDNQPSPVTLTDGQSKDTIVAAGVRLTPNRKSKFRKKIREAVVVEIERQPVETPAPAPAPASAPSEEVGIEALKTKLGKKEKLTVSHVGATTANLSGMTDDALRAMDLAEDLSKKIRGRSDLEFSQQLDASAINLTEGKDFLQGAGHGVDVVVLHRIPDPRTAEALKVNADIPKEIAATAKEHSVANFKKAISDSGAELVYVWGDSSRGDMDYVWIGDVPGYTLQGNPEQQGAMGSGQFFVLEKIKETPAVETPAPAPAPAITPSEIPDDKTIVDENMAEQREFFESAEMLDAKRLPPNFIEFSRPHGEIAMPKTDKKKLKGISIRKGLKVSERDLTDFDLIPRIALSGREPSGRFVTGLRPSEVPVAHETGGPLDSIFFSADERIAIASDGEHAVQLRYDGDRNSTELESYPDTSAVFPTVPSDSFSNFDGLAALQLSESLKKATELYNGRPTAGKPFDHFAARIEVAGTEVLLNPYHLSSGVKALSRSGVNIFRDLELALVNDSEAVVIRSKRNPENVAVITTLKISPDVGIAYTTVHGEPRVQPAAMDFRPGNPGFIRHLATLGGRSHDTMLRVLLDDIKSRHPNLNIVLSDNLPDQNVENTDENWVMLAKGANTIYVNVPRLSRTTKGMLPADTAAVVEKLVIHETIHNGVIQNFTEQELSDLAAQMTDDQKLAVATKYFSNQGLSGLELQKAAQRWAGINQNMTEAARRRSNISVAHEYLRQQYELATTGRTTEDIIAEAEESGLISTLVRYLRAAFRKLQAAWNITRDPDLRVKFGQLRRTITELVAGEENLIAKNDAVASFNPDEAYNQPLVLQNRSMQQEVLPASLDWDKPATVGLFKAPAEGQYRAGGVFRAAFRWDKRLWDKYVSSQNRANAEEKRGRLAMANLNRVLKKIYGNDKSKWPTDVINRALGNLDNRLNERQKAQAQKILRDSRRSASQELNKSLKIAKDLDDAAAQGLPAVFGGKTYTDPVVLRGLANTVRIEARKDFKDQVNGGKTRATEFLERSKAANLVLAKRRQTEAREQLPPEVLQYVDSLRNHVDHLSRKIKDLTTITPELKAVIDSNLGLYMHRSYEIFDNPDYKEWILQQGKRLTNGKDVDPEALRIIEASQRWVRQHLESQETARLMTPKGGGLSQADAKLQAKQNVTPKKVQELFNSFLSVADGGAKNYFEGVLVGNKPIGILMKRGDIPPEIQDLWGVYKDPAVNAAKTLGSLSKFLNSNLFLQEIYELGNKEGWVVPESKALQTDGTQFVLLRPDDETKYGPLAGMYGPRELRDALEGMTAGNANQVYSTLQQVTGFAMFTKTALSWMATARNWFGNILFMVANGHIIGSFKHFNTAAIHAWGGNLLQGAPLSEATRLRVQEQVARYVELGIVDDSTVAGLIDELLLSTDRVGLMSKWWKNNRIAKAAKRVTQGATNLYGSMDDFWKIIAFESELQKLRKIRAGDLRNELDGVTDPDTIQQKKAEHEEKLQTEAAKTTRNTMPTYSQAPEIVKIVRRFPFLGPFVTFVSEVWRTSIGVVWTGGTQFVEGFTGFHRGNDGQWSVDPSRKNSRLAVHGLSRLVGIALSTGGLMALQGMVQAMRGFDREDEEDLRKHVAPWEQNGMLLMWGRDENGGIKYVNGSYLNPYDALTRWWRSLSRDRPDMTLSEKVIEASTELAGPFAKEQIFFSSVMDAARGIDASGAKVWDQNDTTYQKYSAGVLHILEHSFEPGTSATIRRIVKGHRGVVSPSGRKFDPQQEWVAGLLGFKTQTVDFNSSLTYAARKFQFDIRDANSEFTKGFKSSGTQGFAKVVDGYNRAEEERRRAYLRLREKYASALRQSGMSKGEIRSLFKTENLGSDALRGVMTNTYNRYEPTSETRRDADAKGRRLGEDRMGAWLNARDQHERTQTLSKDDRES